LGKSAQFNCNRPSGDEPCDGGLRPSRIQSNAPCVLLKRGFHATSFAQLLGLGLGACNSVRVFSYRCNPSADGSLFDGSIGYSTFTSHAEYSVAAFRQYFQNYLPGRPQPRATWLVGHKSRFDRKSYLEGIAQFSSACILAQLSRPRALALSSSLLLLLELVWNMMLRGIVSKKGDRERRRAGSNY
jgi:hypothetical protein